MRKRIMKDGAIPAKYKLLMAVIADAIAAHGDGVRELADDARARWCLGGRDHRGGRGRVLVRRHSGGRYGR